MDAWLAFQITSNHGGKRLADHQPNRLVVMTLEQRPKRRLDSPHRAFDRLALRWTDGFGVVDPLAKQLCVSPADFVDLEPLPQSLVKVAEFVDPLGPDSQDLADDFRGPDHIFAGT